MADETLNEIIGQRKEKAQSLRERGINPFPNDFQVKHTAKEIHEKFSDPDLTAEEITLQSKEYVIAGRILALRSFGKAAFLDVHDRSGKIQVFIRKQTLGDEAFSLFNSFDMGDFIGVVGKAFKTRTGELSILASTIRLLTKSYRPLPEKWHGLTDRETRYRQRYVDLFVNPKVRENFVLRNGIIKYIRNYLDEHDFIEVETPMLHPIAGGAAARPFITHHNTLDMALYLRIAPELYLKRLVVGGFERVYEVNRNFRNEGISIHHNPEFTMIEFYQAYATYTDLMALTEEMISSMAQKLLGEDKLTYQGELIDYSPPWSRITVSEGILKFSDFSEEILTDRHAALEALKRLEVEPDSSWELGKILMEIFERVAEPKLIQPTFVTDFPLAVSPLSRKKDADPSLVDRFELYIAGMELANAFSELNDPEDQKERFMGQMKARSLGDDEAHQMDEDYIRALEYGMPPCAGEGIGIDRLTMLFTDSSSIRDVILFPLLRPEKVR